MPADEVAVDVLDVCHGRGSEGETEAAQLGEGGSPEDEFVQK